MGREKKKHVNEKKEFSNFKTDYLPVNKTNMSSLNFFDKNKMQNTFVTKYFKFKMKMSDQTFENKK